MTLVAAAGVAGVALISTRGHQSSRVAVAAPTSTTVEPSTTVKTSTTTATPPPLGDSGIAQAFTPTSASSWWALVDDNLESRSLVVRTVDRGRHWRDVSPRIGYVGSSYFLNADVAWIEASPAGYPTSAALRRTRDGGRSWQRVGSVPNGCELQFVDEVHGWCTLIGAAAGSESVDLSRTTDGGATWTRVSRSGVPGNWPGTPAAIPFGCDKSVTFTSPTVGWSPFWCNGGRSALYRSTDGGSTWHAVPAVPYPNLPSGVARDSGGGFGTPVVEGNDVAMPVTIGGRPGATAIANSADGGTTWRTELVPDPTKQWVVDLIDPTHWRLADGTVLMATDDAGKHWRTTTPNVNMTDPYGEPVGLTFLSTDLGWAIPDINGGPLSWTTDGGATWKPITVTAGPYPFPRAAHHRTMSRSVQRRSGYA